ncbi:MAG: glycosyltransferase family 4 protein [Pirellulaceae bacterium]
MPDRSQSLKILQIASGTDVNGALVHCHLLCRELVRRGHDVTLVCRRRSWLWGRLSDVSLRLVDCEMNRWPPGELRPMADWIRRERFDVMHTHMSRAHMFGIVMKHLTGVPVVATAHSRHFQPHWHLNDRVIANSEATRRFHRRVNQLSPRLMETIHCFIDLDRFTTAHPQIGRALRRQWHFEPDTRVIVVAGDVVPLKGHRYLFDSLPQLIQRYPDLRLVVVGRFYRPESCTRRLRRFQLEHGLERRVKWIGRRDNMHEVLAAADLVVIPSIIESLGMVALESMAAGTPVIASQTGGLTELIVDRHNGLLVPPRDSGAITTAVSELLDDQELARNIRDNGMRWVHERFSPAVLTTQIERVLREVAAGSDDQNQKSPAA